MRETPANNIHTPSTRKTAHTREHMRHERLAQPHEHTRVPWQTQLLENRRNQPHAQTRPSYKETRAHREKHSLASQVAQLVSIIQGIFSRKLLLVLVVIVLVVVNLAGPVHEFYIARRTGDVLQAKKELIEKKNNDLEASRDELLTEEGIINEARRRGYVESGEVGVNVEGADPTATENPSSIVEYEDTRTWLQKGIDDVFGFNPQEVWDK